MLDFKINDEKCIECGLCVQECPVRIIQLDPKPVIIAEKEKNCLKCQHCLAVCPTAALSILGKDPEDSVSSKDEMPNPKALDNLIKTRRSIRKYKDEEVDQALIDELLATTAHAPTGHNSNSILLSVTDTKEATNKFRDAVYASIKAAAEKEEPAGRLKVLASCQRVWEKNAVDILFRGAPHVLIASGPNKTTSPAADSIIALSYFELLANSHNIGTLWNGMVKWAIEDIDPSLRTLIGIPEDHTIGYVLIFGKSAVKYARAIQSQGLHLNRIKL
ncbi:4Fe-4S dicluster domain-containing protein [Prolixibacteraceae bacterium JC049]|nr:4Fe-4S dicluster domain-containing protein [Prolixibacteraceae bacterium JC049]